MSEQGWLESLPPDDQRWLESYLAEIVAGKIIVAGSDAPWVGYIKRQFPTGAGGIHWEDVPQVEVSERKFSDEGAERDVEVREFVRRFGAAAELTANEMCVIVGDMDTSVALEATFDVLLDISPRLAQEPQGTYVITKDREWCLAFTMIGNLYFGRMPRLRSRREREGD